MPSVISSFLRSLACFRRKKQRLDVLDGAPIITTYGFSEAKEPHVSSHSISSDIEKKDSPLSISEDETACNTPTSSSEEQFSRTNPALLVTAKGQYTLSDDFTYPTLANENEVIIRTHAVGLNPIDWMSVDYGFCLPEFPWIVGREMAGVVEEVGREVEGLQVGDRVWTSTYYKDRRAGCFQQAVTVPAHTVLPMSSNLSFEESATLGVAGLTAAMTLWRWLSVPEPSVASIPDAPRSTTTRGDDEWLLIWGGAATTGQFAIQLAHLSGMKTICVASAQTSSLCVSLGATHVVARDGKSAEDIIAEIRAVTGDNITAALDLVGSETAAHCLKAVSQSRNVLFAPLAMMSKNTPVPANVSVETVEMKRFVLDADNAVYAQRLNALVQAGQIKVPALEVIEGGFGAIEEGLRRVKNGNRSGKKLVVTVP